MRLLAGERCPGERHVFGPEVPGRSFTHKRPESDTLPPTSRPKKEEEEPDETSSD